MISRITITENKTDCGKYIVVLECNEHDVNKILQLNGCDVISESVLFSSDWFRSMPTNVLTINL